MTSAMITGSTYQALQDPAVPFFAQPGGSGIVADTQPTPGSQVFRGRGPVDFSVQFNGNVNQGFTIAADPPVSTTPVEAVNNLRASSTVIPEREPAVSSSSVDPGNNVEQSAKPQPAQVPGFWNPTVGEDPVIPSQDIKPNPVVPNGDPANEDTAAPQAQDQPLSTRPAGGFRDPLVDDPSTNVAGGASLVDPQPSPVITGAQESNIQGASGQTGQSDLNVDGANQGGPGDLVGPARIPIIPGTRVSSPQGKPDVQGLPDLNLPSLRPAVPAFQGSNTQDAAGQTVAESPQNPGQQVSNPLEALGQSGETPANAIDPLSIPDTQGSNSEDTSGQNGQNPASVTSQAQDPGQQATTPQGTPGQSGQSQAGQVPTIGVTSARNPGAQGVSPQNVPDQSGQSSEGQNPGNAAGSPPGSGAMDPQPPQLVGTPQTTFQLGQQANAGMTTMNLGIQNGNPANGAKSTNAVQDGSNQPAPPVVTVADHVLTISDPSAIPIAGTFITPGGAAVDISGTSVILAPSGNLVFGAPLPKSTPSVITIAGNIITANPTSINIAGTPVRAGGPGVTVSGVPVSFGSSGDLVVGNGAGVDPARPTVFTYNEQIITADSAPGDIPPAVFTVSSVSFTANPTAFAVGGATLSAGGPGVTVDSTPVSLNPQGALVIASDTIPVQAPAPSVLTANGQAITILPDSGVAVGGQTLKIGDQAVTAGGVSMSVGPAGVIMGSDTVPLPTPTLSAMTTKGVAVTFQQNSQVAVDGKTLSIGGQAATVSGVPVSVGHAGVLIGSDTIPMQTPVPTPSIVTTNGVTATIGQSGQVAVDGNTLNMGGQDATVNEVPITVASDGLIIGSDTISLKTATPTASTLTTDGQVLTFQQSGRVAIGGTNLSIGGQDTTISGEVVSVATNGLVIGTDKIPLPTTSSYRPRTSSVLPFFGGTSMLKPLSRTVLWGLLGFPLMVLW